MNKLTRILLVISAVFIPLNVLAVTVILFVLGFSEADDFERFIPLGVEIVSFLIGLILWIYCWKQTKQVAIKTWVQLILSIIVLILLTVVPWLTGAITVNGNG